MASPEEEIKMLITLSEQGF